MKTVDTYIRPVASGDRREFLSLMRCSRVLHAPWITPPTTDRMFDQYIARMAEDDHCGLVICRQHDDAITGVINVNSIVRGTFLSASLGYYVGAPYAGHGYMSAGLRQAVRYAFEELGLHRLEANIQPHNERSLALVARCGFVCEGLSKNFLYIDGAWRDHERWAIHDPRATLAAARHTERRP